VAHPIAYYRTCIAGVDAMSAVTDQSFPAHTHDQYGLGMVVSGGHRSRSDRKQVTAWPGSMISVNPGEVHDGHAIGRTSRAWRMLYFDCGLLNGVRADIREREPGEFRFPAAAFQDSTLQVVFKSTFRTLINRDDSVSALRAESLLLCLIRRMERPAIRPRSASDAPTPNVRRAMEAIDADPGSSSLTLQHLADVAGLSRYQLIRGFAGALGLPPHAYVVQRRLALARRLIKSGERLAEVALRTGFADQSHLSNVFHRQFGVSPGFYGSTFRPTGSPRRNFLQDRSRLAR